MRVASNGRLHRSPAREAQRYAIRNLPNRIRIPAIKAEAQRFFRLGITTELSAILIRKDGTRIDLGVLSRRVVTTAGVAYIANCFINTVEAENMNFHGSGTGVAAEAIGDVALGAEVDTRASGTQTSPAGGQYRTVAIQTYAGNRAITEHGIFSAAAAGTLLDRSLFAAINVANLDQIQWTYTITFNSGG